MKKIAIMGLCNYENMGDQIIARTVDYLVRQCGEEYDPYYVKIGKVSVMRNIRK